jgi:hypothetical protein
MTGRPASPTWEEVLASFEATVVRSEVLLSGTGDSGLSPDADGSSPDRANLDGAVLDGAVPAGPDVIVGYDLSELAMPPVPEHLTPRANALRVRQVRVARQLQAAMVGARRQAQVAVEANPAARRPVFVDRRA